LENYKESVKGNVDLDYRFRNGIKISSLSICKDHFHKLCRVPICPVLTSLD